jgi:dihydrofolate synthase/folylpolyglutamate synthase
VIRQTAAERKARLVYAPDDVAASTRMVDGRTALTLQTPRAGYGEIPLGLRGHHQVANAIVAARLLEELTVDGRVSVSRSDVRAALEHVEWPGRLELRRWRGRSVLIDGAHNPAGARALAAYLQETYGRPLPIVIGAMSDKHIDSMVAALAPVASHFVCTAVDSKRAAAAADIAAIARTHERLSTSVFEVTPPIAALETALPLGEPVVVAGSLYLAGELRAQIT